MATQKTPDLKALLKKADAPLKYYVAELEAQNLKLQKQIAKLQANEITLKNRVKALEKELRKHPAPRDLGDVLRGISERKKAQA